MESSTDIDIDRVRRYGGPIAHAALHPERQRFHVEGIDGLIAHTLTGRCEVMLGDPICASKDKPRLVDAFAEHAWSHGRTLVCVAASGTLRNHVLARGWAALAFADLLATDPRYDFEQGPEGRHLRQQLNRARREGVTVQEYRRSGNERFENRVQSTYDRWRSRRRGPQMYLGTTGLFDHQAGRRWFIAQRGTDVLGCLSLLEAAGTGSPYLINLVVSSPEAPAHTNELMIVTALAALGSEGCQSVCLGIGPRSKLGSIEGCRPLQDRLARWLYQLSSQLLHPDRKTEFWKKFGATPQEPLYLLFQNPRLPTWEVYALFRAFHASIQ